MTTLASEVAVARSRSRLIPIASVVLLAVAGLVLRASSGDYGMDAGPSLHALVTGHVGRALELQPLMGSFSLLVRLPFALAASVAGAGEPGVYRAGIVPCLGATAAVGVWLARRRGAPLNSGQLVIPLLAVLTPASLATVRSGHPEEALAAALAVAAVLLAEAESLWAGVALGLALATKQWAVLAVAPVVWAAPRRQRTRLLGLAVAVAGALTLPLIVGSLTAFSDSGYNAATAPLVTGRTSIWFLVAHQEHLRLHLPPGFPTHLTVYLVPQWVARISHPLIVLMSPLLALLVWRRKRRPGDAFALLALVFLLRCVLDSVDNEYYHLPFLLALLAYECVARRDVRGLPLATLGSAASLWIIFDHLDDHGAAPRLTNTLYLVWATLMVVYLLHELRLLPHARPRLWRAQGELEAPAG